MATSLNDLASAVAVNGALAPIVRTTSVNGSAIDLVSADGTCFAIQQVGSISEGNTWTGTIEESSDATTWSAVAGAAFTPVTTASNIQTISFRRTKRYVRYVGTVGGGSPSVPVSAVIGEAWKTF